MTQAVKTLAPTMQAVLRQMDLAQNPLAVSKAQMLTAKAIKTFDPASGAQLHTWVNQQMQPLRRFKRSQLAPTRVPERIQLDALHLFSAEQDFRDKHNREPDLEEISDFSKLPPRRVSEIRRQFRKVTSESSYVDDQGGATGMPAMRAETDPLLDEAMHYVYQDCDAVDRRILELKTGFGGKNEPMDHAQIVQKLKLSPAGVSRRAARLGLKIQQAHATLLDVTGGSPL